jgi:hypothetical protein
LGKSLKLTVKIRDFGENNLWSIMSSGDSKFSYSSKPSRFETALLYPRSIYGISYREGAGDGEA